MTGEEEEEVTGEEEEEWPVILGKSSGSCVR